MDREALPHAALLQAAGLMQGGRSCLLGPVLVHERRMVSASMPCECQPMM